jgi:methylenetetrahydrofolate reductase (NADPH)
MSRQRLVGRGETSAVSFEFFPPKTAETEAQLWKAMRALPLRPHFVSVTYGAAARRATAHATVKRLVDGTSPRSISLRGAPRPKSTQSSPTIGRRASVTSWR